METFPRGIINETLERHKFFKRKQEVGETFDEFLTDLRLLSKNCNFCSTNGCFERLLIDRIVAGVKNGKIREKLLREKDLTLLKTIDICRLCENASDGIAELSKSSEDDTSKEVVRIDGKRFQSTHNTSGGKINCKFCGRKTTFGRDSCPAWGKKCRKCNELNSFEKICTKRDTSLSEIKKADSHSTNPITRVHESLSAALFLRSIGAAESLDLERGNKVSNCWEILIPTQTVKQGRGEQ